MGAKITKKHEHLTFVTLSTELRLQARARRSTQDENRRIGFSRSCVLGFVALFEDVLMTYGYLGVFAVSIALNLLPFTSPSNLIIAGAVAFLFPAMNPILIGLTVAIAASLSKTAHYYVASYVGTRTVGKAVLIASILKADLQVLTSKLETALKSN